MRALRGAWECENRPMTVGPTSARRPGGERSTLEQLVVAACAVCLWCLPLFLPPAAGAGGARRIPLNLADRDETLPTSQQIVFPQSLSCRDTKTTMTCNQDFGLGEFN